ncbi:MAG: hypothetical protein C4309_09915 [Chloroflexota bacterium]|mgnify:FL=1
MTSHSEQGWVKMLLSYDILTETEQEYYQYVLGEFLPRVQTLGLEPVEAWHTAYGDYPIRMIALVAENPEIMKAALTSPEWKALERKLKKYIVHYQRRIVPYREGFQF